MKRCFIISTIICGVLITSCAESEPVDPLQAVYEEYSVLDVVQYYEYRKDNFERSDLIDYLDAIDRKLIIDEIGQEQRENVYSCLFEVANEIGYSPSVFFGEYCINEESNVIHKTNSDCLEKLSYCDMYFPGEYVDGPLKCLRCFS